MRWAEGAPNTEWGKTVQKRMKPASFGTAATSCRKSTPDGRYTYIYTEPDGYEPLAQVHNWTNEEGETYQETCYFHCDHIGIPREMTDKDGNLLWFGNYTGWGRLEEETKVTDSAYQPFRLQNQYADRETGLHDIFFRYYEPNVRRFMSQDLIGLWGGDNLYTLALISING